MLLHSPEPRSPDGMLHSCMRDIFHFSLAYLGNSPERVSVERRRLLQKWKVIGWTISLYQPKPSRYPKASFWCSFQLNSCQSQSWVEEKKAFAAVLCSFCNEVQHSFNKTAMIVAAAAAAIVALTYWDCHNEPPLGADACISWKRKKVHWSRFVFGKAVHMILVLPLLFILSSFVGYLPSFSIPSVNSLLFSPFVPPLKR